MWKPHSSRRSTSTKDKKKNKKKIKKTENTEKLFHSSVFPTGLLEPKPILYAEANHQLLDWDIVTFP